MFCRKHTIPQEFEGDNIQLLHSSSSEQHFCKFCKVHEETEAMDGQNDILAGQIDELKAKLEDSYMADLSYKQIKAQRKAATELNRKLQKQVQQLRNQLQLQTDLEEKCRSEEIDRQAMIRQTSNRLLENKNAAINNRFRHREALEEQIKLKKSDNKVLSQ
ncbi:hypothetical protein F2P81_012259 [Scomber scombrus]|uniref:Uncharacterized protein n=1 Tax=Scomber scombrus TaxID=13677 RepID=A0AAV1NL13_SCOSC